MDSTLTKIDSIKTDAFIIIDSTSIDTTNINSIAQAKCNATLQEKKLNIKNAGNTIDVPVIVSIIIFVLGFIISEAIRRRNKSKNLKQYKQFIQEWVEKSNDTLVDYINSLEVFSNIIKTNTDLNIAPWRTGIIHLSEINKIPLEKFSDIYIFGLSKKIKNENRKQIMNFLYQIEYLNKVPILIMEVYNKYCENNQRIMDEWNTYYMQLLDLLGSTKSINPQTFEGHVFLEIYKLFIPLINTPNGEYAGTDKWRNEFVIPAINILTKEKCADFPILVQIMILVRNLNIVIIKHDKLNDYSRVFNSYVENLKKAQLVINNSMSYFDGKEIRHFCI